MNKICTECNREYEKINFCPNCGRELKKKSENKIDQKINKIDEKVKIFNEKKDEIFTNINNELSTSKTVQKAKEDGKKGLETIRIIIGLLGVAALFIELVSPFITGEPNSVQRAIHPYANAEYYDDLYNASFTVKFERLLPTVVLPTIAIIIAGYKKPWFFLSLILLIILFGQ